MEEASRGRARGPGSTPRSCTADHGGEPSDVVLARIRFAAARGRCVDLDYVSADGRRALRRIEPYALRRSRDGSLVLHARRAGGRLHRAYRVERIRGARLTRQRFTPPRPPELGTWPDEG